MFFIQCSPAQGTQIIERIREDLPKQKVNVLAFDQAIDDGNLYQRVSDYLRTYSDTDILFIRGLEYSLLSYEETQREEGNLNDEEIYSYSWKAVPRLLGNLNLRREKFRDNFPIRFVFLLPLFAIKYLSRRAPDFFDWRSGVFEIPYDPEILERESSRLLGSYKDYVKWTQQERDRRIIEVQCLAEEPQQTPKRKAQLFSEQGDLLTASKKYEAAIVSYDKALKYKPDLYIAWYNRGFIFRKLERYDEAIASYTEALKHKPDSYIAWSSLGASFRRLGRLREAITSNNEAIRYQPNYFRAWYNNACYYALLGEKKLAISNLKRAIDLNPKYREMASTDSDFDGIRNDDRFQALINQNE